MTGVPPDPTGGVGKTGPLTVDEFALLWRSVTDRSYWEPFVEVGEGQGYEAHTQAFAQQARVSLAVDRSTQALYVLPWSGQTDEPASGGAYSSVGLTFARAGSFLQELTFVAGTFVEEVQIDFSDLGGVEVRTGRRYALTTTVGLGPGVAGPLVFQALAEAFGRGYDNPAPGTLISIVQPGSQMFNDGATVIPGVASHQLVVQPIPDVILPEHVGQYLEFTAGANAGQIRRISGYIPPNPYATNPTGGTALLATTVVARFSAVSGTFNSGELVEQGPSGSIAVARVLYQTATHLVMDRVSGAMTTGTFTNGVASGASCVFDSIDQEPDLVAETPALPTTAGASWRVLDWALDLGVTVTNVSSPSGGRAPILDQIGSERSIARGSGEGDDAYREAIANLADVVSPNAIRRCINRALANFGVSGWLREVGTFDLPGLYLDGDPLSTDPTEAFAYDLDFTVRPQDRYKLLLDYTEFRAFFLVGVPQLGLGEFGGAFDAGPSDAFDASPYPCFFDGYPLTAACAYRTLWGAVNAARAAGVGFDLVLDPYGSL